MKLILLESQASIVVTDMRNFTQLAEQIEAMELGIVLSSYYEHIANAIEKHGGRVAKFMGDGVLAVFTGMHRRQQALALVRELSEVRAAWLANNARMHLPSMDYTIGVATGEVLAGEMGTDRVHFWDVIGAPVNFAFRLGMLANDRGLGEFIDAVTLDGLSVGERRRYVEVDAAELGGKRHRLFRLDSA